METIILNLVKNNNFYHSSLNKILINGSRNSFQNLNFQCNPFNVNVTSRKRNLCLSHRICSINNNNLIKSINNKNNIFNIIQANSFLTNVQNVKKCQPSRFFSGSSFVLDNNKNGGNDKVKIDTEKFIIGFTCKKCNNRSYKFISKKSYYEGVVIIRCDKCKNLHLIADHLGWYDSLNKFGTIEDYFKRQENNPSGNKTIIKKNLQQLTKTEQNDVIEFLREEQKDQENEKKK